MGAYCFIGRSVCLIISRLWLCMSLLTYTRTCLTYTPGLALSLATAASCNKNRVGDSFPDVVTELFQNLTYFSGFWLFFCLFSQNWHKIWKSQGRTWYTTFILDFRCHQPWPPCDLDPWWARQGISYYHSTSCSYILGWRRYMLSVMKGVQNIYSNIFLPSTLTGVLKLVSDLLYVILLYI